MKSLNHVLMLLGILAGLGLAQATANPKPGAQSPNPNTARSIRVLTDARLLSPDLIKSFENSTGISVDLVTTETSDETIRLITDQSQPFDVIIHGGEVIDILIKSGSLRPLDRKRVPNFAALDPVWLPFWPDPDCRFSVPLDFGAVGFLLARDVNQSAISGYMDAFRIKRPGGVAVMIEKRDLLGAALLSLGAPLDGEFESTLKSTRPILMEWLRNIHPASASVWREVPGSRESLTRDLIAGKFAAALLYSGDASRILAQNPEKFEWVFPREGALAWMNRAAVLQKAQAPEAAFEFLNFLLSPTGTEMLTEYYGSLKTTKQPTETIPKNAQFWDGPAHEIAHDTEIFGNLTRSRLTKITEFLDSLPPPSGN